MYSSRKTLPPEIRRSLSEPEIKDVASSNSGSGFQQNVRFGPPPEQGTRGDFFEYDDITFSVVGWNNQRSKKGSVD